MSSAPGYRNGANFVLSSDSQIITRQTLGRAERLKHRKKIDELFQVGKSFAVFPYRVYYQFGEAGTTAPAPMQFGIGVSKRYFKKSVDRNRIKRLSREAYRTQCNPLREQLAMRKIPLYVFVIFTGREMPQFAECQAAMNLALQKLQRNIVQQT